MMMNTERKIKMSTAKMTNNRIKSKQEENDMEQRTTMTTSLIGTTTNNNNKRKQFSSVILFVTAIIILNLCPFHTDFEQSVGELSTKSVSLPANSKYLSQDSMIQNHKHLLEFYGTNDASTGSSSQHLAYLERFFAFVKLMFTNPMRLSKRSTRFSQADAKMLGKMAKMWFIKKKIKKLSKKLKKHTIAVPVFTAIPIYEHSYYPQPHVTHVTHGGGLHHAAAASSYSSAMTPATAAAMVAAQHSQQLVAAASNNHQQVAPSPFASARQNSSPGNSAQAGGHHGFQHPASPMSSPYHHHHHQHPLAAASAQHIINSYAPSPPLYVDEAGGLYGHYGNAYGRYDAGYQMW